jgi:YesN/AraC family two-component response regulator
MESFLVLSDINMPKLIGMELREKVHNYEDLRTNFSLLAGMWVTELHQNSP